MTAIANNQRVTLFRTAMMLLGGLAGGVASFTLITGLRHLGLNFKTLPIIDLCGFMLGVAFFCCGIFVFLISFSARWAGKQLEQSPDAPPATRQELVHARMQGAVLFLAGLLLVLPQMAVMTGWVSQNAKLVYAAVVAGFVLQTALNIEVWRKSDEFIRALAARITMFTFWVLQGVLFLAAAGEKLGLFPHVPLWNACVIMLAFYFVAGIVMTARCARWSGN